MNRKERTFTIEGIAIALAAVCMIFVVPSLINIRADFSVLISGLMVLGLIGWAFYFVYRIERDIK